MPPSEQDTLQGIYRIFDLVYRAKPRLLPACRWLVAASEAAASVFDTTRPTPDDLRGLLELLEQEAPSLVPLGHQLAETNDLMAELLLQMQLDALLADDGWCHPAQVVWHPPLMLLLRACRARLKDAHGEARKRLTAIEPKLRKAFELQVKARLRKAALRREASQASAAPDA